jgi:hypothetical protein
MPPNITPELPPERRLIAFSRPGWLATVIWHIEAGEFSCEPGGTATELFSPRTLDRASGVFYLGQEE